jgi:aspartate oxidase
MSTLHDAGHACNRSASSSLAEQLAFAESNAGDVQRRILAAGILHRVERAAKAAGGAT